jgi:uncharacterized protein YaeQ
MAIKATIFKVQIQLADMDRHVYADDLSATIARHPSETDERMMVRILALAMGWPQDQSAGTLAFAKDMWDPDEPALWHKNYVGEIVHWVEVGQPDDKRLMKACGRSERVTLWAFQSSTDVWWPTVVNKLARADKLTVWQLPSDESMELSKLAARSMQLQVTVQDGTLWVGNGSTSVELHPHRLMGPAN